jgi:flagellar protein FlaG
MTDMSAITAAAQSSGATINAPVVNEVPVSDSIRNRATEGSRIDLVRAEKLKLTEGPDQANQASSAGEVLDALSRANSRLASSQHQLKIDIDAESGRPVVSIEDLKTGRVLLQIPSDESMDLARRIDRMIGVFVDRRD